jgi:hypothetical protein
MSANDKHKWTHLKIAAYHKSHSRLQQYQCPALFVGTVKMTKAKLITAFRSIAKVCVGVSTAGSTNILMRSAYINYTCTLSVLCQILITKLSVKIYVSALYKPPIVPIDVRTSQFVARLLTANCNFGSLQALNFRVLENQGQFIYSPLTLTCRTVTHSEH